MNTIELAKQAGTAWSEILDEGYLDRFRALCVAERDKELIGLGMEPVANVVLREGLPTLLKECDVKPSDESLYTAEKLAASVAKEHHVRELDARQYKARIAELEANLKRATVALKAQQLETTCECKNCMNATEAIIEALKVDYDQHTDVLTVDGVRYSGHIFRTLALCAPGTWLRFEDRRDGVVSVFTPGPEMERAFDAMTGKGAIYGA
jgi:hypothetical protein